MAVDDPKTISELDAKTSVSSTDIFPIVDNDDAVPGNKKMTIGTLLQEALTQATVMAIALS